MTGALRPQALPANQRLRRASEFQAVFQQGKRVERPGFIALWHETAGDRKVGFTVSRKVRGAVRRNRVRRRLREAYRLQGRGFREGISVIFVGREGAEAARLETLTTQMRDVLMTIAQRAGAAGAPEARRGQSE